MVDARIDKVTSIEILYVYNIVIFGIKYHMANRGTKWWIPLSIKYSMANKETK